MSHDLLFLPGELTGQNIIFNFCHLFFSNNYKVKKEKHKRKNTKWNNMPILSSDSITKNLQVGIANDEESTISVAFKDLSSAGLEVTGLDVLSHATSQTALDKLDAAISEVDSFRADLGAKINRLNYAADNLSNISINASASRSRIQDADYAKASSELARTQIIQQAGMAMLAQANQQPQTVLSLLQ